MSENDVSGGQPALIEREAEREEVLTCPRGELVAAVGGIRSPLVILGAGGKMGPTLAVLAKRAALEAGHDLEVIAVSRFGDEAKRRWLEGRGIATQALDLLDPSCLAALPEAGDVLYLVGLKFGTAENPSLTWAANVLGPVHAARRYAGKRIVALSTGNVYPLTSVGGGGSREEDPLTPIGEYANAAVARERLFEHFSRQAGGPAVALLRLNYATDLRYGVPVDLAHQVWNGEPVPLAHGFFNCIWQGDANELILRAFSLTGRPARPWNLTSPAVLRVREVAERLGELMGRPPRFSGREEQTALLSNPARLCAELGAPPTAIETVLRWTAHWVKSGGDHLGKPTHFEVRDGAY